MKGTLFKKPLEFQIQTDGEKWNQGESLNGTLSIKNHSKEAIDISSYGVYLAYGEIKKIQQKKEGMLKETSDKKSFNDKLLPPSGGMQFDFQFKLDPNVKITDKKSSYYLVYGPLETLDAGYLQLQIDPRPLYNSIVGLFDTFHRFKLKDKKMSKEAVEFKLIPPNSKEFLSLEALQLQFSIDGGKLFMHYIFKNKKLNISSGELSTIKNKVEFKQDLLLSDFLLNQSDLDQDKILKKTQEILDQVRRKIVF